MMLRACTKICILLKVYILKGMNYKDERTRLLNS